MVKFFAHFLFLLAAWTLVIKFAFPISFSWHEGSPLGTYVLWDFWWTIHLWLGWTLIFWQRYTYVFAISVSVLEISIITIKFTFFLADPSWTIWTANWFINKLFVLACFVSILGYFFTKRRELRLP